MPLTIPIDAVADLMRETASELILPRFNRLTAGDIDTKSGPGDLVTIADREGEERLTPALQALLPGSVVVGEEAVSADGQVLKRLSNDALVWLVDPVDGTANFVAGNPHFGVMVALVASGETVAGWIYAPVEGVMAIAERGAGACVDSGPIAARKATPFSSAYGDYSSRYVATEARAVLDRACEKAGGTREGHCSAYAYLDTARGEIDFVVQYLMSPWDHAAGSLMVEEAGGAARFLDDGTPYTPQVRAPRPMLVTGDAEAWPDYAAVLTDNLLAEG